MMGGLYDLALAYREQGDGKSLQRAFLTALLALFLSGLGRKATPRDFVKRISNLLQSLGFPQNLCGWLERRSHYIFTDFLGLVSVLIQEGLFPSETDELSGQEVAEETVTGGCEIVSMEDSGWRLPEGFSKEFPASVAAGELSMRVERLLDEGCRCLETAGYLTNVCLVSSSRSTKRRITIFGTDTSSDRGTDTIKETLRQIVAENGADSAMMLECIDLRSDELIRSPAFLQEAHGEKAIFVVAKDAKGAAMGEQSVNLIKGKYVFEEPIVTGVDDDWFGEFTFPVQPTVDKQPKIQAENNVTIVK